MNKQKMMGYWDYVRCLLLISVSLSGFFKVMSEETHEEMRNLSHISVGNSN